MKRVVGTSQVAHLWANRSQDEARNGRNFYFDGDTIFSYGRHFPIARHTTNPQGGHVILFTTETYSNTTAKHISEVRSAIRGEANVFYVADVMAETKPHHIANHGGMIRAAMASAESAKRSRVYAENEYNNAVKLLNTAAQYSREFGLGQYPIAIETLVSADELAKIRARSARGREQREERNRQFQARWRAEQSAAALPLPERMTLWREGKPCGSKWDFPETLLRIRGDEIETSRGARFPVKHAKLAFRLIAACRADSRPWARNGHSIHLGGFSIDSIDADGNVKAGCHLVSWEEIERLAQELGLFNGVDSETDTTTMQEELVHANS